MSRLAAGLCLLLLLVAGACSSGDDAPDRVTGSSSGCDREAAVAPGEERVTVGSRFYIRHVPPGHGRTPMPVILDLHGYLEGAEIHARLSALGTFGDRAGFITLTPHGYGDPVRWRTSVDSPDVRFLGTVLDHAEGTLCVDRARVYVTGLSNGAMMTSVLACALSDRIAAVAPVAGVFAVEECDSSRPVPVIAFHGTDDQFVRYGGGYGGSAAELPAPDGSGRRLADVPGFENVRTASIPAIVRRWAVRNGCDPDPATSDVAADVTVLAYPCPRGADVELYRVDGGGHAWPGSEISALAEPIVGHTTMSISANERMWAFFEAHPLTRA